MSLILVVENNKVDRDLMRRCLRLHHVVLVENGKDALEAFKRESEINGGFDVVVTDIDLGASMSGFKIAEEIRRLSETVKIILITGQETKEFEFANAWADEMEVNAVVEKVLDFKRWCAKLLREVERK